MNLVKLGAASIMAVTVLALPLQALATSSSDAAHDFTGTGLAGPFDTTDCASGNFFNNAMGAGSLNAFVPTVTPHVVARPSIRSTQSTGANITANTVVTTTTTRTQTPTPTATPTPSPPPTASPTPTTGAVLGASVATGVGGKGGATGGTSPAPSVGGKGGASSSTAVGGKGSGTLPATGAALKDALPALGFVAAFLLLTALAAFLPRRQRS